MLIRIGEVWYRKDGLTLVAVDAPETVPAEGAFIDGDKLAAELDGLTAEELDTKVTELVGAYADARQAAISGGTAELEAAKAAQVPAMIAGLIKTQRVSALAELDDLAPEGAAGTPPNAPAVPKEPAAPAAPAATPTDPPAGDPAPAADPDDEPVVVPDDLSGLPEGDLATVAAAARILARTRGTDPAAALTKFLPGGAPAARTASAPVPVAPFVAAAGRVSVSAGAAMGDDLIAEEFRRYARGARNGRAASSEVIGSFLMYGDQPALVASAAPEGEKKSTLSGDFHQRRAGARGVIAAAPDRCGPNDVRREIPDCGDLSSPLLGALQSYPAPHCKLEYYQDISIASVADGITTWDEAARDAYQDALDLWRATPDDPQLFADLKAAEKTCAIAGCATSATVTMLPIAACLEYPSDLEYCSPESIRAYRRALNRLFLRERTSNMLAVIETLSIGVTVDAAAAPFISALPIFDGTDITNTLDVQVGAMSVLDIVLSTLKPHGVMAERVTEGNYTAILPYGLQLALELDGRLAEGVSAIRDALGVNVITTLDTATGTALPFGALPAVGSSNAFSTLRLPSDWDIILADLDDFFEISRPDIELGAQMTPESARGNMVFGGFMESFAGYGKDGCHPSWSISLSNLVYNGVRVDRMSPVGGFGA